MPRNTYNSSMSLIGNIVERNDKSTSRQWNDRQSRHRTSGFPLVEHRSQRKSEFARAKARQQREEDGSSKARTVEVPKVIKKETAGDWREGVSRANEERVAA